jgi:hypothetical protein
LLEARLEGFGSSGWSWSQTEPPRDEARPSATEMRHIVDHEIWRRLCAAIMLIWVIACSRENRYDEQARTGNLFARALARHDTVEMRALSTPIAGSRMAVVLREIPPEYMDFSGGSPTVVREGNPSSTDFFVASRALRSCHGGLLISITPGDAPPRVSSIRLEPRASESNADPCRVPTR